MSKNLRIIAGVKSVMENNALSEKRMSKDDKDAINKASGDKKIKLCTKALKDAGYKADDVSPNVVNLFFSDNGVELKSGEVTKISDTFESVNERNFDGTGPDGGGPMTGRGMGNCTDSMDSMDDDDYEEEEEILFDSDDDLDAAISDVEDADIEEVTTSDNIPQDPGRLFTRDSFPKVMKKYTPAIEKKLREAAGQDFNQHYFMDKGWWDKWYKKHRRDYDIELTKNVYIVRDANKDLMFTYFPRTLEVFTDWRKTALYEDIDNIKESNNYLTYSEDEDITATIAEKNWKEALKVLSFPGDGIDIIWRLLKNLKWYEVRGERVMWKNTNVKTPRTTFGDMSLGITGLYVTGELVEDPNGEEGDYIVRFTLSIRYEMRPLDKTLKNLHWTGELERSWQPVNGWYGVNPGNWMD